jgi:hypothetical protein
MNRQLLVLFIALLTSNMCISQQYNWRWARGATSTNSSPHAEGVSIDLDSLENVYSCGWFGSDISFGPYNLTGNVSCFIAKYDSSGNILWAKTDSCPPTVFDQCGANCISTDAFGHCFICGGFADTVYFDSYRLTGTHFQNPFLAKYDNSGNVLWAKGCVGGSYGYCNSCDADASGNSYITGTWGNSPSVIFGTDTLFNQSGYYNFFLVKYDSTGNVLWAKTNSGTGGHTDGMSVKAEKGGFIYLAGQFTDSVITVGTNTLINVNPGTADIFVAKYDSLGNELWARSFGGAGTDVPHEITCDSQGNIYFAARFDWPYGGLIVKLDPYGNMLWSKNISATMTGCYRITTDIQSNIYATGGYFTSAVNIGGDTILPQPANASDPLFIVKYDSTGHLLYAVGVNNGGDDACGIAVAPNGSIYLAGDYTSGTFWLGNDILSCQACVPNGEQFFAAKLICNNIQAGLNCDDNSPCPGSCINFMDLSLGSPTNWEWSFPGATPNSSQQQNPTNICYPLSGNYNVTLIASNANGTDTLSISDYIHVNPTPAFSSIIQSGDTLFAQPGLSSYQWYNDTTKILFANNYYYVANHNGSYSVIATDTNGCNASATLLNIIASTKEVKSDPKIIITNNQGEYTFQSSEQIKNIKVFDCLGRIFFEDLDIRNDLITLDLKSVIATGIYYVSVMTFKETIVSKIFIE